MTSCITDPSPGSHAFTLIEALIVASIIALLATLAMPLYMKPREQAQRDVCIRHLRILNDAKNVWAMERIRSSTDTPSAAELDPYLNLEVSIGEGTKKLTCPKDPSHSFETSYDIGTVNESSRCKILPEDHKL